MSTLATILNTLVVILAVLLIALILVQPSKSGGGFGSAFGGLGESVFGAQAMSHLSKLTVWCISIFFVLTLASAIVAGHMQSRRILRLLCSVPRRNSLPRKRPPMPRKPWKPPRKMPLFRKRNPPRRRRTDRPAV